jgi:osmoprotectant transport system permease protein
MLSDSLTAFIAERLPELWLRTGEHLMLTGCSTGIAILVGVPLGILVYQTSWLRTPVLGTVGILQTIPSLAMLVFLLALVQRIGVIPAITALTLYALLPIVRNTLTGLEGIDEEVMEAAKGIGMTEYQQLRMVRIPLATPVIMAGIRTAAVVGVGIATLSAFIGAGGLGQFINRGLALSNTQLILLGAIPAAMLALVVDFSIGAFAWGLRPERKRDERWARKRLVRTMALLTPFLLVLVGVASYLSRASLGAPMAASQGMRAATITIGSKNFTEQLILGELMAQLIEAKTNLKALRRFNLGGTMICHGALVSGEIDLYAEYTGTGLTAILNHAVIHDPEEALRYVDSIYRERFRLRWLKPFGFNNTYAIAVRAADATDKRWTTVSDLKESAPSLRAGFTAEFAERPDGYPGLRQAYNFQFGEIRDLDPSLMYDAIAESAVDVICAFATDGRILSYKLHLLEDDRGHFPPYHAAPVVREELLHQHPEIEGALSLLGGLLDTAAMQRLNLQVDAEKRSPADVANAFLRAKALLP